LGHPQKRNADAVGRLIIEGMAGAPKKSRQSAKASKPKAENRPLPPLEEWDFGSVAEDDLPACYLWEYWREKCHRDSSIADALNSLRAEVRASDDTIRRHDQRELTLQRLILASSPDLPAVYTASLKYYGEFNLYLWSDINPLSSEMDGLANISEMYFPRRTFQSLEPSLKQIIRAQATPKSSKGQRPPLEEISTSPSERHIQEVESVTFQINWDHTDEQIQEAFREWVRLSRGDRKASITKGLGTGKSITKTLLKDLKALGAMRLLAHYESGPAALDALKKIKRSLFSDKADWFKAKKHAENILQNFEILSD
jgi:hypothetical protein